MEPKSRPSSLISEAAKHKATKCRTTKHITTNSEEVSYL